MEVRLEDRELTPEERQQAGGHWHSLMFAPSRDALETARQELGKVPMAVQLAVMNNIAELWMHDYAPTKDDNPFVSPEALTETLEAPAEVPMEGMKELEVVPEIKADAPKPRHPMLGASLFSAIVRLCNMELSFVPRDHLVPPNHSLRRVTSHH